MTHLTPEQFASSVNEACDQIRHDFIARYHDDPEGLEKALSILEDSKADLLQEARDQQARGS